MQQRTDRHKPWTSTACLHAPRNSLYTAYNRLHHLIPIHIPTRPTRPTLHTHSRPPHLSPPLESLPTRRTCCVVRLPARSLVVWCAYSHAAYDKRKRCRATSLIHSDSPSFHTPPPALSDLASCLSRPVCRFPPFSGSFNYSPVPFTLRCSTFFFVLLAAYLFYNLSLYMQLTLVESHIFQEETSFTVVRLNRCQPVASTFLSRFLLGRTFLLHIFSPARCTGRHAN